MLASRPDEQTISGMAGARLLPLATLVAEIRGAAHVCRGTWKDAQFKEYNFNALGLPTAGGHLHPLLKASRTDSQQLSIAC